MASYDYCTVSKFDRNTSRAFTLEYCAKTAVYGAILEQNVRFRPIYGSLRRSVMIDLGISYIYIYFLSSIPSMSHVDRGFYLQNEIIPRN